MIKLEDLVGDRQTFNNIRNTCKSEVKEAFSLEKLTETYKSLEANVKAWKESDNYIGTRPEEGRLVTIGGVQCLIWVDSASIGRFNIRLIHPSQDKAVNKQLYQAIIAELDRQGVMAKRYG